MQENQAGLFLVRLLITYVVFRILFRNVSSIGIRYIIKLSFFMKAPCKVHLILKTYLKNDIPVVEVRVEVVHTWPHTQAVHPVPVHLNRGRSTTVPVHLDRGRSTIQFRYI